MCHSLSRRYIDFEYTEHLSPQMANVETDSVLRVVVRRVAANGAGATALRITVVLGVERGWDVVLELMIVYF